MPTLYLDKAHSAIELCPPDSIHHDIWHSKYRFGHEQSLLETIERCVQGIYVKDQDNQDAALEAISKGLWIPGGRILAGAGTPKRVTLMNCYVNATVGDNLEDIMDANRNAALTMQQGGGIGTDFSTLRPEGALLTRTHTKASGPIPFMHMWDSMSATIRSAGDRRGAMMGTLCDTHPDIPAFIKVKQKPSVLTNFNISILISDAFMEAVKEDEEWLLYFSVPPITRSPNLAEYDFEDEDTGEKQYVYSVWRARELWELITKATYEFSEPGVIFIDRINDINNLHYCETIRCTNPCGEQPLPPHGTCNLGAVNLARLVRSPFTEDSYFDFDTLRQVVRIGTRFLDNVIDVTGYPLPEQENEEKSKRRLGLGITGLADCLAELGLRYGAVRAANMAEQIMEQIAITAYETSVDLAKERGNFPLYDQDGLLASNTFISLRLPPSLRDRIRTEGLRNGLILTIAPTGTGPIPFGYPSSGLEPTFQHEGKRRVRQERDDVWKEYPYLTYGAKLFQSIHPSTESTEYPGYMVEMKDLSIHDHIVMQSRVQRFIDASVSKTVNMPQSTSYDSFVQVYDLAYNTGCKGCTTYRYNPMRGSVLISSEQASSTTSTAATALVERPQALQGTTYKIKWPRRSAALYLTINSLGTNPFEILISSKDARDNEWTTALTLMITGILRKGGDYAFIPTELQQIQSVYDGAWIEKKYYGSLPAYIGHILQEHLAPGSSDSKAIEPEGPKPTALQPQPSPQAQAIFQANICPNCQAPALVMAEGCAKCLNCGHSECG